METRNKLAVGDHVEVIPPSIIVLLLPHSFPSPVPPTPGNSSFDRVLEGSAKEALYIHCSRNLQPSPSPIRPKLQSLSPQLSFP